MKKGVLLIILGIATLSFNTSTDEASIFVQFKVNTVADNANAMVIDQKMRTTSGIEVSRMDYITGVYFCVLAPGFDHMESNFVQWFNEMGYTISCFNKGIHGIDPVISPSELKDCQND